MLKRNQLAVAIVATLAVSASSADEITTSAADQTALNVTIYNSNVALIKDRRQLTIPDGVSSVAFKDVSASIRPQTAILKSDHVQVLEQNFEYDLLSEQALLNKYVGETVTVVTHNVATGESTQQPAVVLSNNQGVMLKIGDKIQPMLANMSIIYDKIPKNLRDKPTMSLLLNNQSAGEQAVELTYLSDNLNWKADYVAHLLDSKKLNLKGWVTLTNNSGSDYPNAKLQLVAGELNRVQENRREMMAMDISVKKARVAAAPQMSQESLFEYHLYTLDRPTTIKNKQQKQVSLLVANDVPYEKRLVIKGQDYFGWRKWDYGSEYQALQTEVKVIIDNKKANHLGMPIPAGVIRTYQNDSNHNAQFIGEDHVTHTPENERIELLLGKAFDVTAKRKQSDFNQKRIKKQNAVSSTRQNVITASYEIIFKNAKDEAVKVEYLENFSGNWSIDEQSLNSEKINANTNRWLVNVPAKGESKLTYTVTMVY